MFDRQAMFSRNADILFKEFDDGIMMMNIDSGQYFDIDGIGARIWSLIEQPSSLAAVCETLVEEYAVDADACEAQTGEFLSDMIDKDLIRTA